MNSIGSHSRPAKSLTFHELAPIMAFGEKSYYGKGKSCPRDGKMDCSIVEAVFDKGQSRQATHFLSWRWNYTLEVASDALQEFLVYHEESCPRDGKIDCSIVDAVFDKGQSRQATHFLSWCWNYTLVVASDALQEFLVSHEESCPIDGKMDCSIVDAVFDKGQSRQATHFLSWCWNYTLEVASDALQEFLVSHGEVNPRTCYLWWCFYQNNQHRILGDARCMTTDELSQTFGSRLQTVGRMLCLMNRIRGDQYTKRIWCIFEVFIAQTAKIPFEIILPSASKEELDDIVKEAGIGGLKSAIEIDVEKAEATKKSDETNIKSLIVRTSSFVEVNAAATAGLSGAILNEITKALK